MIKLTKRLEECVKYTRGYNKLADIGTDHALLVSYAVLNNYVNDAIASDVAKGPLEFARKTINKCDISDRVKTTLESGVMNLDQDVDVCVIAGMGGTLIADILECGKDYINNVKRFIVQPNIASYNVRKWISNNKYKIVSEEIIEDNSKIYEIIVFEKGEKVLSDKEIYFGPLLRIEKSDIYLKKHSDRINRIKDVLVKIPENDSNSKNLISELKLIQEEIGEEK